jgi:hypothetical protein
LFEQSSFVGALQFQLQALALHVAESTYDPQLLQVHPLFVQRGSVLIPPHATVPVHVFSAPSQGSNVTPYKPFQQSASVLHAAWVYAHFPSFGWMLQPTLVGQAGAQHDKHTVSP